MLLERRRVQEQQVLAELLNLHGHVLLERIQKFIFVEGVHNPPAVEPKFEGRGLSLANSVLEARRGVGSGDECAVPL